MSTHSTIMSDKPISDRLDSSEAATGDHEGEQLPARGRIGLEIGVFELVDHVAASVANVPGATPPWSPRTLRPGSRSVSASSCVGFQGSDGWAAVAMGRDLRAADRMQHGLKVVHGRLWCATSAQWPAYQS